MIKRTIQKKLRTYSVRLDETEHAKLMEIKKDYNLSVVFRNALNDFYEENIASKKK